MHFLDDPNGMDVMLDEQLIQFVCVAKLTFNGGEGILHTRNMAKSLRSHDAFVTDAINRLVSRGMIAQVDKVTQRYCIVDYDKSKFAGSGTPPIVQDDAKALPVAPMKIAIGPPKPIPEPDPEDWDILHEYHRQLKIGGDYYKAADHVRRLRAGGYSTEDLMAAITGYARTQSDKKWTKFAVNFFEPFMLDTQFFGAQYIDSGYDGKLTPKTPSDIHALSELMRARAN